MMGNLKASTNLYRHYFSVAEEAWYLTAEKRSAQIIKICKAGVVDTLCKDFRVKTKDRGFVKDFVEYHFPKRGEVLTPTQFLRWWNIYSFDEGIGLYADAPTKEELQK